MKVRTSLITKTTWLAIISSLVMAIILTVFVVKFFNTTSAHYRDSYGRIVKSLAKRVHEKPTQQVVAPIVKESNTDLCYHGPALNYVSDNRLPNFNEIPHTHTFWQNGIILTSSNEQLVASPPIGKQQLTIHADSLNGPWEIASELIIWLVASLAIFWSIFCLLQRRMLAPLTQLRDNMEAVGAGVWRQIDMYRQDESGELEIVFHQMQQRWRALLESKERFLADTSHELRSPLARLRLALEFLEEGKVRGKMVEDVAELENLTDDILAKTRLDSFRQTLNKSQHCVEDIFAVLSLKYPQAVFGGDIRTMIFCDKEVLIRALGNLIDNAIKFSSSQATITCEQTETAVFLMVEDDGTGVDEKELPHLFEPFYRTDVSRSRHTGGFGLGLSIVHATVSAHNGELRAVNKSPHGLAIKITLPKPQHEIN